MRKAALGLLTLIAIVPLAAAEPPVVLETRSAHYSLSLEVQPSSEGVRYAVRVTDVASGQLLADPVVMAQAGAPAQATKQEGDLRIMVSIRPRLKALAAVLEVTRGELMLDRIESSWLLAPTAAAALAPLPPPALSPSALVDGSNVLRVGGEVKAPVVINRVEPIYSEDARRDRISGIVIVEAIIDKSGMVRDVRILKDLPDGLGAAAVDAVRQWTFRPATMNGEPVPVIFSLTVSFKLNAPPPEFERVPPVAH